MYLTAGANSDSSDPISEAVKWGLEAAVRCPPSSDLTWLLWHSTPVPSREAAEVGAIPLRCSGGKGHSINSISGITVVVEAGVALLLEVRVRWVCSCWCGCPKSTELAPPTDVVSIVPLSASELTRDARWFRLPVYRHGRFSCFGCNEHDRPKSSKFVKRPNNMFKIL